MSRVAVFSYGGKRYWDEKIACTFSNTQNHMPPLYLRPPPHTHTITPNFFRTPTHENVGRFHEKCQRYSDSQFSVSFGGFSIKQKKTMKSLFPNLIRSTKHATPADTEPSL